MNSRFLVLFLISLMMLFSFTEMTVASSDSWNISPKMIVIDVHPGEYKEIEFAITGYQGTMLQTSSDLPVTFETNETKVANGKIKIIFRCNDDFRISRKGVIIFSSVDGSEKTDVSVVLKYFPKTESLSSLSNSPSSDLIIRDLSSKNNFWNKYGWYLIGLLIVGFIVLIVVSFREYYKKIKKSRVIVMD
jgi:hypothetical protein